MYPFVILHGHHAYMIQPLGLTERAAINKQYEEMLARLCDGRTARCPSPRTEQLGGFGVIEARDLNHAIQLISKHPGVKAGPFEIRPADDLTKMIRESERRRSKAKDK